MYIDSFQFLVFSVWKLFYLIWVTAIQEKEINLDQLQVVVKIKLQCLAPFFPLSDKWVLAISSQKFEFFFLFNCCSKSHLTE